MRHHLFRTSFISIIIFVSTASATAQAERSNAPPSTPPAQTGQRGEARTSADEEFELNISERRIIESDYEASTSVEVGDAGESGLQVRVGVMLRAAEIDVLLRNVRGHVRFRGNLEPLLRRLALRRAAPSSSPRVYFSP